MIEFRHGTGGVSLVDTDLDAGVVVFRFRAFTCSSDAMKWTKSGNGFVAGAHECEFKISAPRGVLRIETKNKSRADVFLKEVEIVFSPTRLASPLVAREYREYVHSFNFASLSGVKKVGLPNRWLKNNPESSLAYVLQHIPSGNAILVSVLPPHRGDYVSFRALHHTAHLEGNFGLTIKSVQQRLVKPARKAAVSPIQCRTGRDPLALLEELGTQWSRSRRRPIKDVRVGWNSWDYFAGAVTSRDIFRNQRRAKELFRGAVRHFVIDEGWEPRWGAWVANWKFPEGLRGFCRKIKAEGGVPGIWTAPFLVNCYTDLYRDHPEWFGRDSQGNVVKSLLSYGPMACLDITHPEVEQFIHDLFKRLRRDGFEYFKVDFAALVLKCERFHDMTTARSNRLRKGFETIRRAVGDDAYLLACGAPYESVTGIVDAVRVTGDIHNFWGHVLANAASMSARWWMHGKLWNVDPDFFIVRSRDTSPDKRLNRESAAKPVSLAGDWWLAGRELVLNEVKVYALLVYLSGGDIFLGDDLGKLNNQGIAVIRRVLETPRTRAAVPVDLFDRHDSLPGLWAKEEDDFQFVGVFNWDEDPKEARIDLRKAGCRSLGRITTFWSGEDIEPRDGVVSLHLEPRSCEGLMIAKGPR